MAIFYKYHKYTYRMKHTLSSKSVMRPGIVRICLTTIMLAARLGIYLLVAHSLGTQHFGMFLLLQWLASALLPLIGIGIEPTSHRQLAQLQRQEAPLSAAATFRFLLRRQYRRMLWYTFFSIALAFLLARLSNGQITVPFLLLASLVALPLLLNSIVAIALRSQGCHLFLTLLSTCHALLSLSLVLYTVYLPVNNTARFALLLLIPAFVHTITLLFALFILARRLPLRVAMTVGPLLKQRLSDALYISPSHFVIDVFIWRELPFLTVFLLLRHSANTSTELSYYTFSLLLCSRLIEVVPTCFVTFFLPILARFSFIIRKHPLTRSIHDAFMQATCYISLMATLLCTLLMLLCPSLIALSLGTSYVPMVAILRILLIAVAFSSMATISMTHLERCSQSAEFMRKAQVAHPIPRESLLRVYFFAQAGAVVMYSLLIFPCIVWWGIAGAALASTIVRITFALLSILICRRLLHKPEYSATKASFHLPITI